MPFQSWEMRPMSENSAVLSLTTANFDVEIRIKVYVYIDIQMDRWKI